MATNMELSQMHPPSPAGFSLPGILRSLGQLVSRERGVNGGRSL